MSVPARQTRQRAPQLLSLSLLGLLLLGVLLMLGASGCKSERRAEGAELVTQVQMVRPAADRPAESALPRPLVAGAPAAAVAPTEAAGLLDPESSRDERTEYCRQVERQAQETNAGLPKRLDRDTRATRVVAYGCDVILEYAILDLAAGDVAVDGVRAMRGAVLERLCSDGGARGVMEHGGSFTNVYRDDRDALIDQFTIGAEDCAARPAAQGTPVSVEL